MFLLGDFINELAVILMDKICVRNCVKCIYFFSIFQLWRIFPRKRAAKLFCVVVPTMGKYHEGAGESAVAAAVVVGGSKATTVGVSRSTFCL